jgi:hypothetical protein
MISRAFSAVAVLLVEVRGFRGSAVFRGVRRARDRERRMARDLQLHSHNAKPRSSRSQLPLLSKSKKTHSSHCFTLLTWYRLFHGAKKKFKVKRKTFDREGRIQREDKEVEITVKPGMKAGSKFKFAGIGDEIDGTKQDIHFIVTEKPHPLFVRKGDDLIATISLPLKEALTGWSRQIQTIDGKNLVVSHSGPTPPNWSETYPGLGMVLPKDPSQRGNMIVKVDVCTLHCCCRQ